MDPSTGQIFLGSNTCFPAPTQMHHDDYFSDSATFAQHTHIITHSNLHHLLFSDSPLLTVAWLFNESVPLPPRFILSFDSSPRSFPSHPLWLISGFVFPVSSLFLHGLWSHNGSNYYLTVSSSGVIISSFLSVVVFCIKHSIFQCRLMCLCSPVVVVLYTFHSGLGGAFAYFTAFGLDPYCCNLQLGRK